jgi:hypothetical protein
MRNHNLKHEIFEQKNQEPQHPQQKRKGDCYPAEKQRQGNYRKGDCNDLKTRRPSLPTKQATGGKMSYTKRIERRATNRVAFLDNLEN